MKIRTTPGPGAAHIAWSMFGARGPLLQGVPSGAGGSGGAAPPNPTPPAQQPTPAAPAQPTPPAQGGAPAPDEAALRAAEQRGRDSAFAELRRNGALKKSAIEAMDGRSVPAQGQPGAQPPADPSALRSLDRAITKLALGDKLSDAQWKRAERDFLAESPSDPVAWLKDYFPGVATQPAANAGTTQQNPSGQPQAPQNPHPASGAAGAPARGLIPLDQANVLTMSPEDIAAHVARVGPSAFKKQLEQQLRGVRVKLTPD